MSLGVIVPLTVLGVCWFALPIAPWRRPFERELSVRVAGFAVSLLGVWIIVRELDKTRKAYDHPGLVSGAVAWLRRFPTLLTRGRVMTAHLVGTATGSMVLAGGQVRIRKGGSLEARLETIEQDIEDLEKLVAKTDHRLSLELGELQKQVSAERDARGEEHKQINARLEELTVGGTGYEIMGLAWLILGQGMGSFPDKVADLLGRLFS